MFFLKKKIDYAEVINITQNLDSNMLNRFQILSAKDFKVLFDVSQHSEKEYLCGTLEHNGLKLLITISQTGSDELEIHANSFKNGKFMGYNELANYVIFNDTLAKWGFSIFSDNFDTIKYNNIGYSDFTEYTYLLDTSGIFHIIDSTKYDY